jgi:hypothetical protein
LDTERTPRAEDGQ